jgi:hypothetical protein
MDPLVNQNAKFQTQGLMGPITPEALQPAQPLQLPQGQVQSPTDDQYAAAVKALPVDEMLSALDQPSAAQTQQTGYEDQFLSSLQKLSGQTAFAQKKEQDLGLDQSRQQLMDVTNQMRTLQNEASAIPLQTQQNAEGRGITAGGLQPVTTAALRNNAIKSLSLSSVAATLQGNIALAEQQAEKAVELEFAPVRAQLDYLSKAMEINGARLEREDSKRFQKMSIMLDERKRLLEQAEQDKRTILGWTAEAAKLGNAPAVILNRASASSSPYEALSLLSPYMVDTDAKAQALLDQDLARERIESERFDRRIAQLKANNDTRLTDAQISKMKAEMSAPKAIDAKEYQYKANLFAQRMSNANAVLEANAATVQAYNPIKYKADTTLENTTLGNTFVPATIQEQRQAERNFLNAVLRRESGAVIAPSEFAEGSKQYFPRPGDSEEVLQTKSQNRQIVISSLESEAGPALQTQQTAQPQAFIGKDGKRYTQAADGLYYAQ